MYSVKTNVLELTALMKQHGITRAVLSPGSRNSPLNHTLASCPDILCTPVTDERSAAFTANGLCQALRRPVAACCTSGTALLDMAPAVAEAYYQNLPLLIISADRPASAIGQMDGQTIVQPGSFHNYIRKEVTLPEPHDAESLWYCNRLINEALAELTHNGFGPVHINVPITEPLFDMSAPALPEVRSFVREQSRMAFLTPDMRNEWRKAKRVMIICGQSLPAPGITVREKKSVDQQVQDAADDLDDYGNGPTQSIADPFEPWNRFWFGFNDIFYMYVADPAYKAWEAITPHQLRKGLHNFWHNLLFPVRFINNLLQLRFKEAGVEFGRFIINTTAGVGGLVDVAKNKKTIVPVDPSGEDFGQTLGRWGIPHGFYLVWPILGPSSLRETAGMAGDYFIYPSFAASYIIHPWYVPSAVSAGFFFNDLDQVLPTYFDLKKAAVDPYIMMREAYVKYRAIQVAR